MLDYSILAAATDYAKIQPIQWTRQQLRGKEQSNQKMFAVMRSNSPCGKCENLRSEDKENSGGPPDKLIGSKQFQKDRGHPGHPKNRLSHKAKKSLWVPHFKRHGLYQNVMLTASSACVGLLPTTVCSKSR